MNFLEERIVKDGIVKEGNVSKALIRMVVENQ